VFLAAGCSLLNFFACLTLMSTFAAFIIISFFGDLHCLGKDGFRFYTDSKVVTTRWFDEEEGKSTNVSTWDGTI